MIYYDILGITQAISDFVRNMFWGMIDKMMNMIVGMLSALTNGILNFSILGNSWITAGFNACLTLMFIIIPVKIIYEVVSGMIRDDEASLDWSKKLFNALMAIMIAVSMPTVITLCNNMMVSVTSTITKIDGTNTDQVVKSNKYNTLGNGLLSSVFEGFGGMPSGGKWGAKQLIKSWATGKNKDGSKFDIAERNGDDYYWNFSEIMVIIGLAVYTLLLFMITVQIATRMIAVGFYYVLSPLALTSMTNYQNPQAYNVWKSSLIGQYLMNFSQVFLLTFLANLVGTISKISWQGGGWAITYAQICLYIGCFTGIMSLPNFVQAMIGGYSAGIMESMNTARGGLSALKSATAGLASAAVGYTAGHRNSMTGERQGGIRGALAGNKRSDGSRYGGLVGNTLGFKNKDGNREGGIRGAFAGDKKSHFDKSGSMTGTSRSGGLRGAIMGTSSQMEGKNSAGDTTATNSLSGGLRGAIMGDSSIRETSGTETYQTSRSGGLRGAIMGNTTTKHSPSGTKTITRSGGLYGSTTRGNGVKKDSGSVFDRKKKKG